MSYDVHMKKEYDFTFVYEIKNRELDNVLLLKCELERRGHSVNILETWSEECHKSIPSKSKVLVSFALHDNKTIKYVSQFVRGCTKFVNMQWEQVFTNGDRLQNKNDAGTTGVYGDAKKGFHICWGENSFHELTTKFDVETTHAGITGNVSLDFLRPEFHSFYTPKEELFAKYGLDPNRQTYLFISSFSYGELPDSILNSELYQNQGFDVSEFRNISICSQKSILDWIELELLKRPEITMVYRPHPAESNIARLKNMEDRYTNFRVIGELSIKQWIITVDKIYTWWSTSIAEVFMSGKGCSILRPFEIPYLSELELYNGASFISDYNQFSNSYTLSNSFPLSNERMQFYYYSEPRTPAYLKVADALEEVLNNDDFIVHGYENEDKNDVFIFLYNIKRGLKQFLFNHRFVYYIFDKIVKQRRFANELTLADLKDDFSYYNEMKNKNAVSHEVIMEKEALLKSIMERFTGGHS